MQVLWDASPLTANEVIERVAAKNRWSPRTVKTLLNRLVKKGALGFQVEGKRYHYFPKASRDECIRQESRSFLRRVFGGQAPAMLAHFVSETPLTPEEIHQLRKLLDQRDPKRKQP